MRWTAAILALAAAAGCGEQQQPPTVPPVPMPEPAPIPVPPPALPPVPAAAPTGGYAAIPAPGEELPTSQTTPGPVPLAYRHVWAMEARDCTATPGLTRIAIAPGAVRFYEGRSVVRNSDARTDGSVSLEVEHAAEGVTTPETHVLALTDNERTLRYQRRGETFTYTRCD